MSIMIKTFRFEQNGRHFAGDIFKYISSHWLYVNIGSVIHVTSSKGNIFRVTGSLLR